MLKSSFIIRLKAFTYTSYQKDLFLVPILITALLVRIYRPYLPGPYADEINWAELAMRMRSQNLASFALDQHFQFLGRWWTVAMAPHTIGFPIYPIFVGLYLTKYLYVNRIINLIYGLLIIVFAYYLAKDLFNRKTALITALILILMPTSLRYSRIDVIYIRALLGIGLLAFFIHWYKTGRWIFFYGGALAVGIGMSTRPEILWVVFSLGGYLILFDWGAIRKILGLARHHLVNLFIGLISLLVGSFFFLAYNILSKGGTFTFFLSLAPAQSVGKSNLWDALIRNFSLRLYNLEELLTGNVPFIGVPYHEVAGNDLYIPIFYAAFIILALIVILARLRKRADRPTEFLLVTFSLIFLQSMITTSGFAAVHLLYLFPLIPIIIARLVSLNWLGLKSGTLPGLRTVLAIVVFFSLVSYDFYVDLEYYKMLDKTGGVGNQSIGAFDLADYLETQNHNEVIACDWGISNILYFVTRGKVDATQIFGYASSTPPEFYSQIREKISDPDNMFIFYNPKYATFQRLDDFIAFLSENGYIYTQTTLNDKNGPLFIIFSHIQKENGGVVEPDQAWHYKLIPTQAVTE